MKPKMTTPLLAAIGALVLMVTLFLSFYLSTSAYRSESAGIVLPSEAADMPIVSEDSDDASQNMLQAVAVTPDNAQEVVASLSRPEAYSYTVKNTLFYGGQSHILTRRQYFKQDACRTDEMSDGGTVQRSTLRNQDKFYAWENGSADYYTGAAGTFTDDSSAMLPTYETVLQLPPENITEAGLLNLDYEPCVYVSALQGGYRSVYYISTVSGLLVRADIYWQDTLIRRCVVNSLQKEEPPNLYFLLPDGVSVFD